MRYEELSDEMQNILKGNGVVLDELKGFVSNLHKEFYLKESEVKSEKYLKEYCELIEYLKEHLQYGVNKDWADSELNKYVYMLNKDLLKNKFPLTINALSRFYDDSDIIAFYKSQGAKEPTIIDLIGTTGAGKTTFCQQFVNDESKELLKLTITDSSESTVIQTDILILDETEKKLFLKVRNKAEIISDLLMVALELDLDSGGDNIKNCIKKNADIADKDTIDKVNNYFITSRLLDKFKYFADEVQGVYKESGAIDKFKWVQENLENHIFEYFLDNLIEANGTKNYFYGYRQEYNLETNGEYTVVTTLANTEFKYRKEDIEEYPEFEEAISYRLLFEHAILVLPCSTEARENLEYDFEQGIVFRDSQGHKLDDQNGIASDFEVKNKIFLIPIDTGGYLIDDRYSNIFEKILISQPKNNLFVLTKVDTNNTYKSYKKSGYVEDKKFKRDFSEKITKTHNKLLSNFKDKKKIEADDLELYKDETMYFENFMASFDNAYMSEIDDETYASDAHKINYSGKALEELDKSKLEIEYLESWFDIVGNVLKENKLTYHENILRVKCIDYNELENTIKYISNKADVLVNFYISKKDWEKELDEQLEIFNKGFDFRSIYQKAYSWYWFNFIRDGKTTNTNSYFKDYTSNMIRDIKSYVIKDKNINYVKTVLQKELTDYFSTIYSSKNGDSEKVLGSLSDEIISNSLDKAVKIVYKAYDRELKGKYFLDNIEMIYNGKSNIYVKPVNKSYNEIVANKRAYGTYTEYYEGIYSNILSKFKYNLETYFIDVFKTVIESELEMLDEKVK